MIWNWVICLLTLVFIVLIIWALISSIWLFIIFVILLVVILILWWVDLVNIFRIITDYFLGSIDPIRLLLRQTIPETAFSEWMLKISDNMNIKDLFIPGSHNSTCVSAYFFSDCQDLSLEELFFIGIRYFNFNFRRVNNELISYNKSISYQITVGDIFKIFKKLLDEYSSEFIFIDIKESGDPINTQYSFDEILQVVLRQYTSLIFVNDSTSEVRTRRGKIIMNQTGNIQNDSDLSINDKISLFNDFYKNKYDPLLININYASINNTWIQPNIRQNSIAINSKANVLKPSIAIFDYINFDLSKSIINKNLFA